ncbi:MAG: hypothetical protein ACHREM_22225, partial [Polyangiales bacterium]
MVVSFAALPTCQRSTGAGEPKTAKRAELIQRLELRERFGVATPEEIVDFDLTTPIADASAVALLDDAGHEVPFQLLPDNRVALRTDLPAGAIKTWSLVARMPSSPVVSPFQVTRTDHWLEVTSDLLGVRFGVPKGDASGAPAPLQGVRLRDGTWTNDTTLTTLPFAGVVKMDTRIVEQGPLRVVVRVDYDFQRPERSYGGKVVLPAGPGHYSSTIRVEAGQRSIIIEEDSDADFQYNLAIERGLHATDGRWQGHRATNAEYGSDLRGTAKAWGGPSIGDARTTLRFDRRRTSERTTSETSYGRMSHWDPWAFDTGWYWQLYDDAAPPTANLVGIFAGRPSRDIASFA